jgi:hypothetical protein
MLLHSRAIGGNTSGKKRGIKVGSKLKTKHSLEDWYIACEVYRNIPQREPMSKAAFLRSSKSSEGFTGTVSEQQIFGRKLKEFDNESLKPLALLRSCKRKFTVVEDKLIEYLALRAKAYKRDKCGTSWLTMKHKCLQWASMDDSTTLDFKASDGWLAKTLKRHDIIGINLHGEANDLTDDQREALM